ncbi:MAG: hypothetical protein COT43_02215 [Candidatus Marinimicrobia bacterium CG08_land_8_20_14_0_20_45_22]|nr:MAG: hypothetical protein COT43_02215 [Candidatus Marinimicrobia bacterium CG08_land_8_20_14_0_20_45_22]
MKNGIALSFLLLCWCQIILAQIINEPDFEPLYPCEGDCFPGLKAATADSYKVGIIYIQFSDWQTNRAAQGGIKKIDDDGDTTWYTYKNYWLMTFSDHEYVTADPYNINSQPRSPEDRAIFGSYRDYWDEVSYGKFKYSAGSKIINHYKIYEADTLMDWITAPYNKDYYRALSKGNARGPLYTYATQAAITKEWLYSLSEYEKYIIVFAGNRDNETNRNEGLWPTSTCPGNNCLTDERDGSYGDDGRIAGVYHGCHESGHMMFGLYDMRTGAADRFGDFSLMGLFMSHWTGGNYGAYERPPHLSCYEKINLGWISPTPITGNLENVSIPNIEMNPFALTYTHPSSTQNVYYIENRQPLSFDFSYQDFNTREGGGLLVYQKGNFYTGAVWPNGLTIKIHEADGTHHLEVKGDWNTGDVYDFFGGLSNIHEICDNTSPSSNLPYNIPSRFAIFNISNSASTMTADFYTNAWAGTISSNTTWDKDVYVYGDLTVNSGVILTIDANVTVKESVVFTVNPGAQLKFASGKKITVNGTLIAQGTSSNHITFTSNDATPSAGDWYGIRFEDTSNDANCILKYCDIQYAQYGVYCNRANPKIENNTLTNNNYGIYTYFSSPDIKTNSINNNSTGIYGTNSSPYVYDNKISNNGTSGVEFWTLSQPVFYNNSFKDNGLIGTAFKYFCYPKFGPTSGSDKGFNVVADNDVYGVYNYYYTDPFMGSTDAYNERIGGYNSIANNSGYNLYAYDNCVAYAYWNWWGAGVPPANKFYNYLSWIYYTPYLTTDPGGGSTLGKIVTVQSTLSDKNRDYEAAGFNPKKPNPNRLSDLWLWGHDLFINNKLADAIDIYKILVKKFSQTKEAKHALVKVYHLYHELGKPGLDVYLSEIINNSEMNENLKPMAYELLAGDYLYNKDLVNAGKIYEKIRQKYPDSEHEKLALFCQALATRIDLNDVENAKGYVEIMKQKYQDDELTFRASEEMGEKMDWSLAKRTRQPEAIKQILPEKFALRNNYPNPFNPQTTIAFDLPEESHVTLTIYDVMGREIVRLLDENQPAGFRQVIWDGKDKSGQTVSSGIYLYTLKTSAGFSETKKMALMR